jgi:hypothetical protein
LRGWRGGSHLDRIRGQDERQRPKGVAASRHVALSLKCRQKISRYGFAIKIFHVNIYQAVLLLPYNKYIRINDTAGAQLVVNDDGGAGFPARTLYDC